MSNLIKCEFCGTTYDPAEGPCPICQTEAAFDGSYQGDHYDYDERPVHSEPAEAPAPRGGKILALISLLVLFCGLSVYILYSFELLPFLHSQAAIAIPDEVHCTQLAVSVSEISLTELEQSTRIQTVVQPANTTDPVNYSVDHSEIVSVAQNGSVTAKAPGTATITITCGDYTAYCKVNCEFEVEPVEPEETEQTEDTESVLPLSISAESITFSEEGENTILHPIGGSGGHATWKSSDDSVVTVNDSGYIEAVGTGTAEITVTVGGETVTCVVHCDF